MSRKLVSLVVSKLVLLFPCETSGCKMTGLGIYCMYTTTSQVVKTSVTVNNSPIQDYDHPDDHAPPTYIE